MTNENMTLTTILWALRNVHSRLDRAEFDDTVSDLAHIIGYIENHIDDAKEVA